MTIEKQVLEAIQAARDARTEFTELIEEVRVQLSEGKDHRKVLGALRDKLTKAKQRIKFLETELKHLQKQLPETPCRSVDPGST